MANNCTIVLYPGGYGGDNTTNSVNCDEELLVSSTAAGSNKPKSFRMQMVFDPAVDEHRFFSFIMPLNYSTGGTLRGRMRCTTSSAGNVVFKAGIGEGDTAASSIDDGYNAADTTTVAVSATANVETEFTIALTMTSVAASDSVTIFFGRDADNGSDTVNSNDIYVPYLVFECELS